jgi:hypothetical protein
MQLFSIQMLVLAEVNLIPALEFWTKIDGWGLRSRCMISRWSLTMFCTARVELIISRPVP